MERKVPLHIMVPPDLKESIHQIAEKKRESNPDFTDSAMVRELLTFSVSRYSSLAG